MYMRLHVLPGVVWRMMQKNGGRSIGIEQDNQGSTYASNSTFPHVGQLVGFKVSRL